MIIIYTNSWDVQSTCGVVESNHESWSRLVELNHESSQVQPYNITFVKFQIFYTCINALASSSKPKKCTCILNIFDSIRRKSLVFTMHLSIKLSYFFLDRQNIFKFSIFHEIDDFRINKTIRKISKDFERLWSMNF